MKTPSARSYAIVTIAFATTVAMWALGYFGRLPIVTAPSPLVLAGLLACLLVGGWLTARQPGLGPRSAATVGAASGVLNLLLLGSFLEGSGATALLWVVGFIVASAAIAWSGALLAGSSRRNEPVVDAGRWVGRFARVALAAMLLVLAAGGLVTSAEAGLAVVDWPNTFGTNMFLYPFARMTGGIYYEHTHRLFGALVGLTTLTMAVLIQRAEPRRSVRIAGWSVFAMVVVQGIMGGLRVTGRPTLSVDPAEVAPNLGLALVHGVFAQLCFAVVVGIAVVTSKSWPTARRRPHVAARSTRLLGPAVLAALLLQLTLGAAQRHFSGWLVEHLAVGLGLVTPLLVLLAARAWTMESAADGVLRRTGLGLMIALPLQICLGFAAYLATRSTAAAGSVALWDLTFATAHQWFGAAILALSVTIVCWNRRLLVVERVARSPEPEGRLRVS